jgi:hypothetical protein
VVTLRRLSIPAISPFVSSHLAEARLLIFQRLLLELHPARTPFRIKPFGRIGRSLLYVPMAAVAVFSLIVCRSVASGRTTERCQVAQCGVALTALRPLAPVFASVDSEICSVVIHRNGVRALLWHTTQSVGSSWDTWFGLLGRA